MSRLAPSDVVLIVGKRGCGKSTAAKELAQLELRAGARVVAFDPHDEYSKRGKRSAQVRLGPLRDRVTADQLLSRPSLLDADDLSLSVVAEGSNAEIAAAFDELAELVAGTGGLTLIADEVGEYSDRCNDTLNSLATQSRHYECPVVLVAQRLTQIPKTARTQASTLKTFLQSNPEDLDALSKLTGDKDFAVRVSRLPRGNSLEWRDGEKTP